MVDGGWRTEGGSWRVEDGGWRIDRSLHLSVSIMLALVISMAPHCKIGLFSRFRSQGTRHRKRFPC